MHDISVDRVQLRKAEMIAANECSLALPVFVASCIQIAAPDAKTFNHLSVNAVRTKRDAASISSKQSRSNV